MSIEVNIGEKFYAFKKRGERGNAFKVTNDCGNATNFKHSICNNIKHSK